MNCIHPMELEKTCFVFFSNGPLVNSIKATGNEPRVPTLPRNPESNFNANATSICPCACSFFRAEDADAADSLAASSTGASLDQSKRALMSAGSGQDDTSEPRAACTLTDIRVRDKPSEIALCSNVDTVISCTLPLRYPNCSTSLSCSPNDRRISRQAVAVAITSFGNGSFE